MFDKDIDYDFNPVYDDSDREYHRWLESGEIETIADYSLVEWPYPEINEREGNPNFPFRDDTFDYPAPDFLREITDEILILCEDLRMSTLKTDMLFTGNYWAVNSHLGI